MTETLKTMDEPWLIKADALSTALTIAKQAYAPVSLAQVRQSPWQQQGSTAIIPVTDTLFRHSNLLTMIQGTSSYDSLHEAVIAARDDASIHTIVLDIDSPGGEVNGCAALANTIYNIRGAKPIMAFASGDCASAAYWLASACDRIIVSPTSSVGSIGVVAAYHAATDSDHMTIVSSQSPYKRPDPTTDDGRERLQASIDAIAQVFIDAVAQYRNVDTSTVINDFGGGDVLIGSQAVKQGLADAVGTITDIIPQPPNTKEPTMETTDAINHPTQERERIAAIITHEAAKSRETLAHHLAFATELSVDMALATLNAAATTSESNGFAQAMATISNPIITEGEENHENDDEALAKRIAAAGGAS